MGRGRTPFLYLSQIKNMSTIKFILVLALIFLLALISKADGRTSTALRMQSGNSNGYSMKSWYGGNNKHTCKHMKRSQSRKRQLRY
jgi:hypothetical protein